MTLFLILKIAHILAVITAVGSNVTYAFWLRRAGLDRDRLVYTINSVRALDRSVANPAYIVAFLTGLGMVLTGAYSITTGWILAAIVLYVAVAVIGIALFAPAIRRQLAEAERDPAGAAYSSAAARSNGFGILTMAVVLVIIWLMVTKPF